MTNLPGHEDRCCEAIIDGRHLRRCIRDRRTNHQHAYEIIDDSNYGRLRLADEQLGDGCRNEGERQ